jgi:hypothetical protein
MVDVGQVELADGGSIRSTSSSIEAGAGKAGDIDVRGKGSVRLIGGGAISARSVATNADAGSVRVSSDHVIELIDARRNWMTPGVISGEQPTANSQITVEAPGGAAGQIKLTAADRVELRNSLVTARARSLNRGGAATNSAVSVDPRIVLLDNSIINGRIVGGVGSGSGGGGGGGAGGGAGKTGGDVPVFIDPGSTFLRSAESAILSDAVSAPVEVDIAGSLTRLPTELTAGTMSLVDQCALRFSGDFSSFVVTGRGGVPPEPAGWSPALPWPDAEDSGGGTQR